VFQSTLAATPSDTFIEPRTQGLPEPLLSPWRSERRLAPHQLAARLVLTDGVTGRRAIGYQLNRPATAEAEASIEALARLNHPHLLPILQVHRAKQGLWLIAAPEAALPPSAPGMMTLRDVVAQRPDGVLAKAEARRVITQLASASAWAHEQGFAHGPLTITDIVISRRCAAMIELYGVGASLAAPHPDLRSLASLEARSLGKLGIRLALGQAAEKRKALAGALGRSVAMWLQALAGGEFTDARQAMASLPTSLVHLAHEPASGSSLAPSGSPAPPVNEASVAACSSVSRSA
jgi:hypothetical protein